MHARTHYPWRYRKSPWVLDQRDLHIVCCTVYSICCMLYSVREMLCACRICPVLISSCPLFQYTSMVYASPDLASRLTSEKSHILPSDRMASVRSSCNDVIFSRNNDGHPGYSNALWWPCHKPLWGQQKQIRWAFSEAVEVRTWQSPRVIVCHADLPFNVVLRTRFHILFKYRTA